jgi:excisionase family DNA binding protein
MADINHLPHELTIDRLAERLEVNERHIRRLIAERRVPYRKLGKLIRFAEHRSANGSTPPGGP